MHEIEHVIRLHVPRFRDLAKTRPFLKKKANIAMDLAVNCTIPHTFLPEWVLFPKQFNLPDNETAEWYYAQFPDPLVYTIHTGAPGQVEPGSSKGRLLRDDFDRENLEKLCGGRIPSELERQIVRELVKNASMDTLRARGDVPGHVEDIITRLLNRSPRSPGTSFSGGYASGPA